MAMSIMTPAPAAIRRPRPRWLRSLVLCTLGYLAAEYGLQQLTFSHAEARERAMAAMQKACRSECTVRGLRPDDLEGPFEAPVNFLPASRHYEFLWQVPGGGGLVVMVNDNRLFIDVAHWWEQQEWWSRDGAGAADGHARPHG